VTEQEVKKAIEQFIGEYDQVPPMFSALKVNGQPLYKLARQGIEIERKARRVSAYDIRYGGLNGDVLAFEVDCSSGFYVRSLVEDIGRTLACGAHVKTLRRSRIGKLSVAEAISFAELEAYKDNQARINKLIPADQLLDKFPGVTLDSEQQIEIQFGRIVQLERKLHPEAPWVRIYGPEKLFLGLGSVDAEGQLAPKRLFV
jgi:tRNA pseudouridine55 synthase